MEYFDEKFTLAELRTFCRLLGIPVSGLKNDVIERILKLMTHDDATETEMTQPIILAHKSFFKGFVKRFKVSQPIPPSTVSPIPNSDDSLVPELDVPFPQNDNNPSRSSPPDDDPDDGVSFSFGQIGQWISKKISISTLISVSSLLLSLYLIFLTIAP